MQFVTGYVEKLSQLSRQKLSLQKHIYTTKYNGN